MILKEERTFIRAHHPLEPSGRPDIERHGRTIAIYL
jgi:hypothetical protein